MNNRVNLIIEVYKLYHYCQVEGGYLWELILWKRNKREDVR